MRNKAMDDKMYDITVIGRGPAGLFTTFYGGMRQAKVKLIARGFGDGPIAVNIVMQYRNPKVRLQPKHSTSMF